MSIDHARIGSTIADSEPHWEPKRRPPESAPNVVVIVLDDTGFSHLGCFGSDIDTPNIDQLAADGLRYTNFHTTALCSPTRASLLTGRNHHSVGMRFLAQVDTGFPNCRGVISERAATMAEVLSDAGWSTFALGKWHLANAEDCGPAGPMDHWPLGRGFDRFYGFLGGATDQFSPELVVDNQPVDPPHDPDYHVSEAMVDQAIAMITAQRATTSRPFFTYLAFGATHSPHQAPAAWLEKYRGRYDRGWDEVRAEWHQRQQELGVTPPGTELSPRNPGVPAWDELDDDQQRLFARMQETFAAFLDHTDHQIGRFVDHLKQSGELDNTLIVLLSDNGASQEGGSEGVVNELAYFNRIPQRTPDMIDKIDEIGGPNLYNNYPRGWSQVGNCPLRFYKQNTYEGGVRDPLIVHWPDRISDGGGVRDHYHHVIDVMPTVLRAVGVDAPDVRRGIEQQPIEGVDMTYTFDDPESESRRSTQYYEMLGHRAIYHEGWKAVTLHRPGQPFDEDVWHLYHVEEDFAEIHDLANSQPEKLAEMQQRWWDEAERYGVLPLDDRSVELFSLRRPDSELDRNRIDLAPGTPHLDRFSMPDLRNRSWRITASVERSADDDGVIVAAGSRIGGYSFFVRDGRAVFAYNHIGTITEFVTDAPLPTGAFDLVADFAKTAEHQGRLTIRIGSETLASGDLRTLPWRQAMYGLDIGRDLGSTVTPSYAAPNNFAGAIHLVRYDLDDDRSDRAAAARVESQNALAEQ